ncbi:peptide/nickel transport system substrate-binding protein/oligopeptide transport system substrate-binding protein [Novosphingobium sp. PhB165]|uniref:ABC transporter substrate-binding protein n=1 Tax=Novosphingobium sp. PhB165 TaxID=2485105 RepID=UPI00104B1A93|nr:ABC transporter substrate-binding protein [Novosphingobium sp. PhB165]TCM16983.1 peptide/nickel transport system substrate-binding protein/oligopeptide transport system substrate-binding protein [Novosphingobium sp. PhB165]
MSVSRKGFPAFGLLAALALAGCGSSSNSALNVAVVGKPGDPFETGLQLPLAGQLTRASTTEGLVSFDEKGRVIPALADRWIVTDDGLSYIFRLRDGNWLTGDPLSAASAKHALDSALEALKDTPLALDLSAIDETRAMAGRVIEIRLARPMPYLLQLLAQPELGLVHKERGAGPMRLEREQFLARMVPIDPSHLGLPAIENWARRTRHVNLRALDGPGAVTAFNDGDVDIVMGGEVQDFPLTRSVGILRGTIQLDPVVGLFGLQVMNDRGFLADPSNREAIAMAIDRDALIAPFGLGGWTATTRMVTPSLDGDLGTIGERWGNQSIDERRAVAAGRVRHWESSSGEASSPVIAPAPAEPSRSARKIFQHAPKAPTPADLAEQAPRLAIWLPVGQGADTLFDKLAGDMATIGIRLVRVGDQASADLALVDDVARYPRAAWFLNRLSCHARRGLCSADADARAAEAAVAQSPQDRAALLAEAEAELTAANVFIPFGTPIRWSLVRGSVDGFAPNTWGWHPLMPLSWLPK